MNRTVLIAAVAAAALGAGGLAGAGTAYPAMAPLAQYAVGSRAEEAALARTAAPPSVSGEADVLVLGEHGYETAAKGSNGFVCIVERSWANGVLADEFWNPRLRAPICFNAIAARSVLPAYLERTRWVLAGASKAEVEKRVRAAVAEGRYPLPEAGAMTFMLSKQGYLGDDAGGPWHPHVMFFQANAVGGPESWGANRSGSEVEASTDPVEPVTTFYIPVARWSDGSPDTPKAPPGPMRMP